MNKQKFDNLDKHFNKLASEHKEAPPAFIWDELDEKLPKEKKKQKWIWIFLFGVIGISTFLYLGIDASDKDGQIYSVPENFESEDLDKEDRKTKKINITTVDKIAENQNDIENKYARDSKKDIAIRNHPITNNNSIALESSKPIQRNYEVKAADQRYTLKQTPFKEDGLQPFNNEPNLLNDNVANSYVAYNNLRVEENKNLNRGSTLSSVKNKTNIPNDSFNSDDLKGKSRSTIDVLELLIVDIALLEKNNDIPFMPLLESIVPVEVQRKNAKNRRWFIEQNMLLGIHDTNLRQIDVTQNDYRSQTESNWYTSGGSFQMGYTFNNGIYLQSGLEFIESRDVFEFNLTNVLLEDVMDSMTQNFAVVRKVNYFNVGDITYRQFNIPFTLGGEITKGKFKLGLQSTVIANLLFKANGKLKTDFMTFSRVENEDIYKSRLGFGLRGAVTLGMDITDKSTLYLRPTFSKYLSNTSQLGATHESSLRQYYLEFGCRLLL